MKSHTILLALLFLFIGHFATAEVVIRGQLWEMKGKGAWEEMSDIEYADIRLKGSDCSAQTGDGGNFRISCPDASPSSPIVLEISHEGIKKFQKKFSTIEVPIDGDLKYYNNIMLSIQVIGSKTCEVTVVPQTMSDPSNFEGELHYSYNYDGINASGVGLPDGIHLFMKDDKVASYFEIGGFSVNFIQIYTKDSVYGCDDLDHLVGVKPNVPDSATTPVNVTPMNITEEVLGYNCKKYEVEYLDGHSGYVWADESLVVPKMFVPQYQVEGVKGLVLKTQDTVELIPGLVVTITGTIDTIQEEEITPNLFKFSR